MAHEATLNKVELHPAALTIPEFCRAHRISAPTYYALKRAGLGPREMRLGSSVRISKEAAAEWRRQRENPEGEEAIVANRNTQERRKRAHKAARKSLASDDHVSKRNLPKRTKA